MAVYGPYSPVRQAGNIYYISGQVGVNPVTKLAANDITSQAVQAFRNLADVLQEQGLSLDQVVKTTIFLKNLDDFASVNEQYTNTFAEPRPARSCVAVADLPHVAGDTELLVEVEAVAYKPEATDA